MADMTRVGTESFSRASCKAIALITVASIPIWSAATRSMSLAAAIPRKMLPPPITMAVSTLVSWTSRISRAISEARLGSTPKPWLPPRASPLSFKRIRLKIVVEAMPVRKTVSQGAQKPFTVPGQ